MKRFINYISIFIIVVVTVSCSKDDDNGTIITNNTPTITGDFFPFQKGTYWIYDVVTTPKDKDIDPTNAVDSLYVKTENSPKFTLNVNDDNVGFGLMNRFLSNGECNKTETSLKMKGGFGLNIPGIEIDVPDDQELVLFDLKAAVNKELSSYQNKTEQVVDDIPLVIEYKFVTKQLESFETKTVNNKSYEKVTTSSISVILAVSAVVNVSGNAITLPIVESSEAMLMKNYYADEIGLIHSECKFEVALNSEIKAQLEALGKDVKNLELLEKLAFNSLQTINNHNVK